MVQKQEIFWDYSLQNSGRRVNSCCEYGSLDLIIPVVFLLANESIRLITKITTLIHERKTGHLEMVEMAECHGWEFMCACGRFSIRFVAQTMKCPWAIDGKTGVGQFDVLGRPVYTSADIHHGKFRHFYTFPVIVYPFSFACQNIFNFVSRSRKYRRAVIVSRRSYW